MLPHITSRTTAASHALKRQKIRCWNGEVFSGKECLRGRNVVEGFRLCRCYHASAPSMSHQWSSLQKAARTSNSTSKGSTKVVAHIVHSLDPARVTSKDHVNLSQATGTLFTPEGHSYAVEYLPGAYPSFPRNTNGFFYCAAGPQGALAAEIRFRITDYPKPSALPLGRDLLTPFGHPWRLPLLALLSDEDASPLVELMEQQRLISLPQKYKTPDWLPEGEQKPTLSDPVLHSLHQPFVYDFATRPPVWILHGQREESRVGKVSPSLFWNRRDLPFETPERGAALLCAEPFRGRWMEDGPPTAVVLRCLEFYPDLTEALRDVARGLRGHLSAPNGKDVAATEEDAPENAIDEPSLTFTESSPQEIERDHPHPPQGIPRLEIQVKELLRVNDRPLMYGPMTAVHHAFAPLYPSFFNVRKTPGASLAGAADRRQMRSPSRRESAEDLVDSPPLVSHAVKHYLSALTTQHGNGDSDGTHGEPKSPARDQSVENP